ncbi:MAG: hypothetical protein QM477_02505 [Planctomycetota bacterium]
MNREETWSEENCSSTLKRLRNDYPNYTDNEHYAIWCHEQGLIPSDHTGKVLMEEWQLHASHDGRHALPEGFKVSRPLYGRALKAEKGVAKPSYKRRTKVEMEKTGSQPSTSYRGSGISRAGLSDQAMALALRFDEARRRIDEARDAFRQLEMLRMRMEDFGPALLHELSRTDMEAHEMLSRLGLLSANGQEG